MTPPLAARTSPHRSLRMPKSDGGRRFVQKAIVHSPAATSHFTPMLTVSSRMFEMLRPETPGIKRTRGHPKAIATPTSTNPLADAACRRTSPGVTETLGLGCAWHLGGLSRTHGVSLLVGRTLLTP